MIQNLSKKIFNKKVLPKANFGSIGKATIRTTEKLDSLSTLKEKCKKLADRLTSKQDQNNCIITGAGLSTSCGVPDYRSTYKTFLPTGPGKWEHSLQKDMYLKEKTPVVLQSQLALPSLGHLQLKLMHKNGIVSNIVNQNVDGLLTQIGFDSEHCVDLHGNNLQENCRNPECRKSYRRDFSCIIDSDQTDHYAGRNCPKCGKKLKDTLVYFGEKLNIHNLERAWGMMEKSDHFVSIGTSQMVSPVSKLGYLFFKSENCTIVGQQETIMDNRAYMINGTADATQALTASYLGLVDLEQEIELQFDKYAIEKPNQKKNDIEWHYINLENGKLVHDSQNRTNIENNMENFHGIDFQQFLVGTDKYNKLLGDDLSRKVIIKKIGEGKIGFFCKDFYGNEITALKCVKQKFDGASKDWDLVQEFDSEKEFVLSLEEKDYGGKDAWIEMEFFRNGSVSERIDLRSLFVAGVEDQNSIVIENHMVNLPKLL